MSVCLQTSDASGMGLPSLQFDPSEAFRLRDAVRSGSVHNQGNGHLFVC